MNDHHCRQISEELGTFIKNSPTAFHAVAEISRMLEGRGFTELQEAEHWDIQPGGKYYVTRNQSSLIALDLGTDLTDSHFQITASHSDSPAFKVKEHALLEVKGHYTQLNTEGYGGMLCAPWFDRPLSLAGRAIVREGGTYRARLLDFDRDLLMIPSVAIHMNRAVNEGTSFNKQIDMLPLFGGRRIGETEFSDMVAAELGVTADQVCGTDLFVYNRMEPSIWGAENEFFSAPRLDDLQCAYGTLIGFLHSAEHRHINVYACFDNEEVGSGTKQGAASTFLQDVLKRTCRALGGTEEDYHCMTASSFMVSCDNAHAVHPNHPEKTDAENCVYMNEGVVIKAHAGQKYTSDGVSIALMRQICSRAGVPVQYFANRSDAAGGSTLGNIAMSHVSMNCVDIGMPQLAMHSPCETTGIRDTEYLIRTAKEFYSTGIRMGSHSFSIN